jgi:hypothetical protein
MNDSPAVWDAESWQELVGLVTMMLYWKVDIAEPNR